MRTWEILFLLEVGGLLVQGARERTLIKKHSSFKEEKGNHIGTGAGERHELGPLVYLFSTFVSDPSRGFLQSRKEARSSNGQVRGEYSYMDGFYKVKVSYIAGPSGFRVLREQRISLKNSNSTKVSIT